MTKAKRFDTVRLTEAIGSFPTGEKGAVVEVYATCATDHRAMSKAFNYDVFLTLTQPLPYRRRRGKISSNYELARQNS